MKLFRAAALGAAVCLVVAAPAASESGPQFSVYPSYSAKFDIASEKFSLVTNLVVRDRYLYFVEAMKGEVWRVRLEK